VGLEDAGVKEATAIDISPEMLSKAMRSGFYSCCKAGDKVIKRKEYIHEIHEIHEIL
jgi:predicted TPR repeat methyltransferase